jgi:hypothetical protein
MPDTFSSTPSIGPKMLLYWLELRKWKSIGGETFFNWLNWLMIIHCEWKGKEFYEDNITYNDNNRKSRQQMCIGGYLNNTTSLVLLRM